MTSRGSAATCSSDSRTAWVPRGRPARTGTVQHGSRVHLVRRGREPVGSTGQVRRPDREPGRRAGGGHGERGRHSSLYTIEPFTSRIVHYSYNKPLPHFGGTDAISFDDGLMLISASARHHLGIGAEPRLPGGVRGDPEPGQAGGDGARAVLRRVARDRRQRQARGRPVKLGLTDPDSNEIVPALAPRFPGDFMLTSQGDKEQIYVHDPASGISTCGSSDCRSRSTTRPGRRRLRRADRRTRRRRWNGEGGSSP